MGGPAKGPTAERRLLADGTYQQTFCSVAEVHGGLVFVGSVRGDHDGRAPECARNWRSRDLAEQHRPRVKIGRSEEKDIERIVSAVEHLVPMGPAQI